MKKIIVVLCLLVAIQGMAQDRATVTVKSGEVNNGVVTLTVHQATTAQQAAASFVLHCNKDMTACKMLEPGTYVMVRLPKNWGIYECANVDLYPSTADPATSEKLGEYCLNEK
jgi:hypothetical protein